jgi:hypothetical protein
MYSLRLSGLCDASPPSSGMRPQHRSSAAMKPRRGGGALGCGASEATLSAETAETCVIGLLLSSAASSEPSGAEPLPPASGMGAGKPRAARGARRATRGAVNRRARGFY